MADIARAQVISAVAALLAPTVAPGKVFVDRDYPITEADVAGAGAWKVVPELPEDISIAGIDGVNEHRLALSCNGYVRAVTGAGDARNTLLAAGVNALFDVQPPYGLQLDGVDYEVEPDAEAAVSAIRVRTTARYFVAPSAPDVILSN